MKPVAPEPLDAFAITLIAPILAMFWIGFPITASHLQTIAQPKVIEAKGRNEVAPGPAAPASYRHQVLVGADHQLRFQVFDAEGKPAVGVPLHVTLHDDQGHFLRIFDKVQVQWTGAPDGTVTYPHTQQWEAIDEGRPKGAQWRVRVLLPHYEDFSARFDPSSPPADPLVLRLPPMGSVVALIVMPAVSPAGSKVRIPAEMSLFDSDPRLPGAKAISLPGQVEADGVTRFPFVPLGNRFFVVAKLGHELRKPILGPTRAGEEVSVELSPEQGGVLLVGRLLDPQGSPIPDTEVRLYSEILLQDRTGVSEKRSTQLRTDTEGRFHWLTVRTNGCPVELGRLVLLVSLEDQRPLRYLLTARSLAIGIHDLGELEHHHQPPVLTGRFVFAPGLSPQPIQFGIDRLVPSTPERPQEMWEICPCLALHQSNNGDFEVIGELSPGRYRLRLIEETLVHPELVEFTPGTKDLQIAIGSSASLAATVHLPCRFPWGVFALITPVHGSVEPGLRERAFAGSHGCAFAERIIVELDDHQRMTLAWPAVVPGIYMLEIRLTGYPDALVTIPELKIPLQDGGDPRLQKIDLRQHLNVVTLRVSAATPSPVGCKRPAIAFPLPQEPDSPLRGYAACETGVIEIGMLKKPTDLLVTRIGMQPKELRAVTDDMAITLEPWPEVLLCFNDLPALPDGKRYLVEFVRPTEGTSRELLGLLFTANSLECFDAPYPSVAVVDGRARLPIGKTERTLRIAVQGSDGSGQTAGPLECEPDRIAPGTRAIDVHVRASGVRAEEPTPGSRSESQY